MLDAVWLAVALAMDATAVAAARGLSARLGLGGALRLAAVFGAFQGGMAAIGWGAGAAAARWIEPWDHWLAAGLLGLIGGKMIVEAWRGDDDDDGNGLGWRELLVLGVATSIDSLAAGITLPTLDAPPAASLALIAGITTVLSLGGAFAGRAVGDRLGKGLELLGGLALIGIGAKILVEHLR